VSVSWQEPEKGNCDEEGKLALASLAGDEKWGVLLELK
jgi:hypothetical protein